MFETLLTEDAVQDLRDLHDVILEKDGPGREDYVLSSIESRILQLENHPERGNHPKELLDLGIKEYRQIYFKPYRAIYRAHDRKVVVYLIADGRRDMQALLQRRLLSF